MYKSCERCKSGDVIPSWILEAVFIFYQTASFFFTHGGHFSCRKSIIFGQLPIAVRLFARFHATTRKSLSNLRPSLREQHINSSLALGTTILSYLKQHMGIMR